MNNWHELSQELKIERLAQTIASLMRILDSNKIEYPIEPMAGYEVLNVHPPRDELFYDCYLGTCNGELARRQ